MISVNDITCLTTFYVLTEPPEKTELRLHNYNLFKKQFIDAKIQLVVVEVSLTGRYWINEEPGVTVVRKDMKHPAFYQYAAYNYGSAKISTPYIWCADSDVVFDTRAIPVVLSKCDTVDILQPYSIVTLERGCLDSCDINVVGFLHSYKMDPKNTSPGRPGGFTGLSFVFDRNFFSHTGFYAKKILGGTDCMLWMTLLGLYHTTEADIIDWQQTVYNQQYTFDYIDVYVRHLWHGPYIKRQYDTRYETLERHIGRPLNYSTDINYDQDGFPVIVGDKKQQIIEGVTQYFNSRE